MYLVGLLSSYLLTMHGHRNLNTSSCLNASVCPQWRTCSRHHTVMEKMHLNEDIECILWPWGYREHIRMWISLYVVCSSNFYYERLRINLPPHSVDNKTIATCQLTRLIRKHTAYVLAQRTSTMCFVEFYVFCAVHCNIIRQYKPTKSSPIIAMDGPWGFQEAEAPRF